MDRNEVLIVGGGIAGLTAAIHLAHSGIAVTVVEKHSYPRHKVCGEYISNEVLPYLESLDIDVASLGASQINQTEISTIDGKTISSTLPLGGFGISRFTFDHHLYQKALACGCRFVFETVTGIAFADEKFTVTLSDTSQIYTGVVLGAFGKRSNIDQKMNRRFFEQKSAWLAVKAHYKGNFPSNVVALHNFNGGYCGVSKVEKDTTNICYLANYNTFKRYRNISDYQHEVVCKNANLKKIFSESTLLLDKPLTISQVSFRPKLPVENHVLMIGDSAGLIHPLCGNGMAMAIHSAKVASEMVINFLDLKTSRSTLEAGYTIEWNRQFNRRMHAGRVLAKLLQTKSVSAIMMRALIAFPMILPQIIKRTHGKPITAQYDND
ncbi:MAG TPA: NAD(P)/FAD-dependent oxidoreductase [Flavobacterium sp.]|jgi:hypothetical protein